MGVGMLLVGLLISKFKLSARRLVFVSMFLLFTKVLVYIGFIFTTCHTGSIAGVRNGKLLQPFCSNQCICSNTAFVPICPENSNLTYYSPCFAGCSKLININGLDLYNNCTCGSGSQDYQSTTPTHATEGACNKKECTIIIILYQAGILGIAFTMGIVFIIKILVAIRSVLPQDKGLALALGITVVAFFNYIIINVLYNSVARISCAVWAADAKQCLMLQSPTHGNILNILTAALTCLTILLDIYVLIKVKGLNMYNSKVRDANYTPSLYTLLPSEEPTTTPANETAKTDADTDTEVPATVAATVRPPRSLALQLPRSEITVFRTPSSSSKSDQSNQSVVNTGVRYAQVVFPPDTNKPVDGTSSPKRLVVRADVPLQHLTEDDVRGQLQNLKSFQAKPQQPSEAVIETAQTPPPSEADRPQSPETNF